MSPRTLGAPPPCLHAEPPQRRRRAQRGMNQTQTPTHAVDVLDATVADIHNATTRKQAPLPHMALPRCSIIFQSRNFKEARRIYRCRGESNPGGQEWSSPSCAFEVWALASRFVGYTEAHLTSFLLPKHYIQ